MADSSDVRRKKIMVDWSKLPTELLGLIALRSTSVIDTLRFRSTCTSWRSSVSLSDFKNPLHLINPNPLTVILVTKTQQILGLDHGASLSRASYSRVTLSSTTTKSWLIKHDAAELNPGTLRLLNPLSRLRFRRRSKSIDLTKFTVSEIQQSYTIQNHRTRKPDPGFKRVVVAKNHRILGVNHPVIGVCRDGIIRYWNGLTWTRIKNQTAYFQDLIIHQGLPYAIDSRGILWWISHARGIFRYGPALDDEIAESCSWRYRSLVGGGEKFYIVERIVEDNVQRSKTRGVDPRYVRVLHDDVGNTRCEVEERRYYYRTVGFKVYVMDDDLWEWVEVKSLGGNAFVIGEDVCFAVKADEFVGCLGSCVYFCDEDDDVIKVFKVDDGSVTTMSSSGDSQSCFEMFVPRFN